MNGNFCSLFSTFLALECCCPASPPALTQWTVLSAGAGYDVCPPRPWAGGSRVARTRRRTRLTVPDHAAEWRGRTRCGCAQSERDRNPGSWCTGLFPEPGHRSQGQKDEFTVQQVARTFPEEGMRCERNRLGGAHVEGLGAAASAPGWGGWAGARAGATASRSLRAKRPWRGRDVGAEGGSRAGPHPPAWEDFARRPAHRPLGPCDPDARLQTPLQALRGRPGHLARAAASRTVHVRTLPLRRDLPHERECASFTFLGPFEFSLL